VSDEAVNTMDILPTVLSIAGVPYPADGKMLDGKDISQLLQAPETTVRSVLMRSTFHLSVFWSDHALSRL